MAEHFEIFCSRSVAHVSSPLISAYLDDVDFYTVAENFGIEDESVVDDAISELRIDPENDEPSDTFEVRYRPDTYSPISVQRVFKPQAVNELVTEARTEYLDDVQGPGVEALVSALAKATEVVTVTFQQQELKSMGLVIAGQLAEYFADAGAGVLRDSGGEWWIVQKGVPQLLLGRDSK